MLRIQERVAGAAVAGPAPRRRPRSPIPVPAGLGRRRRFAAAMAVDSVGVGVFMPLSLLFVLASTELGLPAAGLALTVGSVLALPVGPVSGWIVDRRGPRPALVVGNLLQAVGVAGLLLADSFAGVVVCACVSAAGRSMFFGTLGVAVTAMAPAGERADWFAVLGSLRNLGQAVGGLVAVCAIALDGALTWLVALTAGAFAAAAPLLADVPERPAGAAPAPTVALGTVVRDRGYRIVLGQWAFVVLFGHVISLAVPAYVVLSLGLPTWVAGLAFVLNTLLVGFGQGHVVRSVHDRPRVRVLGAGHLAFVVGYVLLLLADLAPAVSVLLVMAGVMVYTCAEMLVWPVSQVLAAEAAPDAARGAYLGVHQFVTGAVAAVSPGLLSALLELGPGVAWGGLGALALVAAVLATTRLGAVGAALGPVGAGR